MTKTFVVAERGSTFSSRIFVDTIYPAQRTEVTIKLNPPSRSMLPEPPTGKRLDELRMTPEVPISAIALPIRKFLSLRTAFSSGKMKKEKMSTKITLNLVTRVAMVGVVRAIPNTLKIWNRNTIIVGTKSFLRLLNEKRYFSLLNINDMIRRTRPAEVNLKKFCV